MSTLLLFCIFQSHRTLPDAADSRLAEEWRVSRIPFAQAALELEASALRVLAVLQCAPAHCSQWGSGCVGTSLTSSQFSG